MYNEEETTKREREREDNGPRHSTDGGGGGGGGPPSRFVPMVSPNARVFVHAWPGPENAASHRVI